MENRRFSRKKVTEPEPRVSYSAESPKGGRDLGISRPGSVYRIGNREGADGGTVFSLDVA